MNKDSFPGRYDTSSAGHIQAGDEPLESAVRELSEELGIQADPDDLHFAGTFPIQYEKEFHGKPFKDNEIAFVYVYDKEVGIDNLTYKKISDASGKFNCHSYAWYSTTSDTNQYWINDPKPLYLNTEYWKKSNASSNLKKDYRVILFDSKGLVHSVIMVSSTKCVSKLGHGGVYITTLKEIKKQYNAKNIQVYIPVK